MDYKISSTFEILWRRKLLKNLLKKNKLKNIFFINSNSKISTKCLLEYSDLVITSGGTIGLESACLGKKILNNKQDLLFKF